MPDGSLFVSNSHDLEDEKCTALALNTQTNIFVYYIYILLCASYVIFLVCIFKSSYKIFCENVFQKNFYFSYEYLFTETYANK